MNTSELFPWLVDDGDEQAPAADRAPAVIVSAVPRLALTTKELAAALNVSPSTVAGWLRTGTAPPWCRLPGDRLLRFRVDAVAQWLANREAAGTEAGGSEGANE